MKKLILFAFIVFTAFSCGNEPEKSTTTPASKTEEKAKKATEPETKSEVKLEITGNDLMQYDKKELKVKAGQKVTLTLKHIGKMEKSAMGHNFVLLKPGTVLADFATKAMSAVDKDYIPESDAVIAHTKMLGGGESDTITFDAPAKGTYDFICSFPGHYAMMKGKFIVE